MAAQTQDDAFHEIQLNGKQLVFLFMAATVVSVVIFLCGVLVGRGVRAERGGTVSDATLTGVSQETLPQRGQAPAPTSTPAGSDPTNGVAPPAPADELSYFNRLEKPNQSADDLKPTPKAAAKDAVDAVKPESTAKSENTRKPENTAKAENTAKPGNPSKPEKLVAKPEKAVAVEARAVPTPAPFPAPAPNETVHAAASDKPAPEAVAQGYAVQIAALNIRTEAEAIARRLSSKGYSAYVIPPAAGTPSVFRVRVGKFGTRREAESVAAKLQKEEQFKPWITR